LSGSIARLVDPLEIDPAVPHLAAVLLTFFGICVASALWIRSREPRKVYLILHIALDITIVTWIVFLTGGVGSQFLFLYLPLIVGLSILYPGRIALFASVASAAGYCVVAVALRYRFLPIVFPGIVHYQSLAGLPLQAFGLL